jgi:Ca-activated chloride channel family protein
MKQLLRTVAVLLCALGAALGDAGILIPRDKSQPDPAILSLDDMSISVRIDNGVARVYVRQIFGNHTNRIEEGNYVFALPSRATVSDFAVWDGPTRIPAVILERKRASEVYNQVKQQMIDPGLLQMGERGVDEARRSAAFSARIVPIAAYGTKRLEIEYHETIPVENLKSFFAIPLHPDAYQVQSAGVLKIDFELRSTQDLSAFQFTGNAYPMKISAQDRHTVRASFQGRNVRLAEDFGVQYQLDPKRVDTLDVIAYRNPEPADFSPAREENPHLAPNSTAQGQGTRNHNEPGFFEAQALIGMGARSQNGGAARNIVVLFDNSLSMQWEKLERSFAAMEAVLRALRPEDHFNLLLFNNKVAAFQAAPVPATRENVDKALAFVRASRLRGGTDLQQALGAALAQFANAQGAPYMVLLSDGGPTRGTIQTGRLAQWYGERWKQLPETGRPRTYVFAVGDDANLPLLRMLARNDGALENVLSTEPLDFKLNTFVSKIGRNPVAQLVFRVEPAVATQMVYPLQDATFGGSVASWVGQYERPAKVAMSVRGVRDGAAFEMKTTATLPERSLDHPQLPRLWARARVDALLEKIEREGEDAKTIDEIIRLSRKYKFVTPYTSFLAVPRALLRPRVIRPGDPILRVRTDESIRSVVAVFPFGLTKRLRHLEREDVWQTRFLAPEDMQDGTYSVGLVLRDWTGRTYREAKTFVIASKPPVVNIRLDRRRYHRGETIPVRVSATASTRTLAVRMEGSAPVSLRWNQKAGASTGHLRIPNDLPAGSYPLTVIAEDVAHNIGTQEVQIEVLP